MSNVIPLTSKDPRRSPAIRAALKGYDPTDEQWRAISHPLEPLYLIAGAGSGKTAVMAARIAWALETQPLSPGQVLGLTFTTKAADELRERVALALDELHDESGEEVVVTARVNTSHGIMIADAEVTIGDVRASDQLSPGAHHRLEPLDAVDEPRDEATRDLFVVFDTPATVTIHRFVSIRCHRSSPLSGKLCRIGRAGRRVLVLGLLEEVGKLSDGGQAVYE